MALSRSSAADEDDIALVGDEGAGSKLPDQGFIDGSVGKLEVVLGEWQFGDAQLVSDRPGLLLGDLGLQEIADDTRRLVLALDPIAMISS
ncbi:hypothetical protein M2281_005692 [Mesorhizobium soli]|nr:hypothetical protein [Mesorhizobium soli]